MSNLYLNKVVLSNFRTYGPASTINIVPGPGLTILCGMNGLGKTAFFEAMEWVLTGDVRRLRVQVSETSTMDRELTRLGVSAGSHSVELYFNDNSTIKRTKNEVPSQGELVALLKKPDWNPEIHDISTYLRLTHFLPQSSRQRFLEQKENDQWQLLKGPAGVERLEKFRALLDDQKARNAFKRIIGDLTRCRDEAAETLKHFQNLLTKRHDQQAIANAGSALSPQQVEIEIGEISSKLSELTKTSPSTLSLGESSAEKLTRLAAEIESFIVDSHQIAQGLLVAEDVVAKWNQLLTRQAATEQKKSNIESELQTRRSTLKELNNQVSIARDEVTRIEGEKNKYTTHVENLRRIIVALQETDALNHQFVEVNEKLTTLGELIATHEVLRDKNEGLTRQRNYLINLQNSWRESQKAFESAVEIYGRVVETKHSADSVIVERAELTEKLVDVQKQKGTATTDAQDQERMIVTLRARLEADQQTADAMAKAVAEITLLLTEHNTVCPVCSHLYPPGVLLARAQASMSQLNQGNALLIDELASIQARLKAAQETQAHAEDEARNIQARIDEIDTIIVKAEEHRRAYESNPIFAGIKYEDADGYIETRRNELRSQGDVIACDLAELVTQDVLTAEKVKIENTLRGAYADRQTLTINQNEIIQNIEQCRAVIENQEDIINQFGNSMSALDAARAEALLEAEHRVAVLETARQALDNAELCEHTAQAALTDTESREAAIKQEIIEISTTVTSIITTWQSCGLNGTPDPAELSQRKVEINSRQSAAERLRERQKATVQGLQLWSREEDLLAIEAEIAMMAHQAESQDPTEAEQLFAKLAMQAETTLQNAMAVSSHASNIANELKQKAGEFSSASLAPLTDRIAAFNNVISPFGYTYKLEANVSPTRTKTRQAICIPNSMDGETVECEPQCFLSEGQTSALGLSVLLGASMEFRWSRWQALLLDDPLQNTDLIHAAAFIDVVRDVMLEQKFQVILSTHDLEEADYIARKCRLAQLPVNQIELLGIGPNGVRTRERPQ